MKNLLKALNERLNYLESEQSLTDGMEEKERYHRHQELLLAIIATQQEILKRSKLYNLTEYLGNQVELIKDYNGYDQKHFTPLTRSITNDRVFMQFCGIELILFSNGTFILNDSTGG